MSHRISSTLVALLLACALPASAQGTSQVISQTTGPFSGSVASGPATPEPLALTLSDAIERGLTYTADNQIRLLLGE